MRVISGLKQILYRHFWLVIGEWPEVLLDGKCHKPIKNVGEEHLPVEGIEVVESFLLFSHKFPVLFSFNKDRPVHFLLGFSHSLHVLFFHLL